LGNKYKPYIRQFAAESFGYLCRKVKPKDLPKSLNYIVGHLEKDSSIEFIEGLSFLFFETIKVRKFYFYFFILFLKILSIFSKKKECTISFSFKS